MARKNKTSEAGGAAMLGATVAVVNIPTREIDNGKRPVRSYLKADVRFDLPETVVIYGNKNGSRLNWIAADLHEKLVNNDKFQAHVKAGYLQYLLVGDERTSAKTDGSAKPASDSEATGGADAAKTDGGDNAKKDELDSLLAGGEVKSPFGKV